MCRHTSVTMCGADDDSAGVERNANARHRIGLAETPFAELQRCAAGKSGMIFERLGRAKRGDQPILGSSEDDPAVRSHQLGGLHQQRIDRLQRKLGRKVIHRLRWACEVGG